MKHFLFFLAIISITSTIQAQNTFKGIDQVVWLGIDYSHVKLVGDFAHFYEGPTKSPKQIRDAYFPAWNNLIFSESNKYDLAKMVDVNSIYYDMHKMDAMNSISDAENMSTYNEPNYTLEDIKSFISPYDSEIKEGIAIAFIAEALSKSSEHAVYHFVAIDLASKELLTHEKVTTKPRGIGLRNYWAGSLYAAIREIGRIY